MRKTLLFLLLLSGMTFGCNAFKPDTGSNAGYNQTQQQKKELKPPGKQQIIHGINYQNNILRIEVMSNGCTSPLSFKQLWHNNQLKLQRIKADHCRRLPHKKWLKFKLPKPFSQLSVVNTLAS